MAKAQAAAKSVFNQTVKTEVIIIYENSVASARNLGAQRVSGERIVFLDADDSLEPDFVEKIVESEDVLQPLTSYNIGGIKYSPTYISPRDSLLDGNHLIIGCPVNRELFLDAGGFDEWPLYEDWALWLKLQKAGATFGKTTGVYNINVNPRGRNMGLEGPETYKKIQEVYA